MEFYCSLCVVLAIAQMFAINSVSQVRGQEPLRDETVSDFNYNTLTVKFFLPTLLPATTLRMSVEQW